MKSFQYVVKDELGIHARPAGLLVKEAKNFTSKITIKSGDKEADATRLMAVMALGVKKGNSVTVAADGADEDAAIAGMKKILRGTALISFEVCCGSVMDAAAAQRGGADRVELNSALSLGGLTPDMGSLSLCKEKVSIPIIAMLRPRGGGFCYTQEEYEAMKRSAELMLDAGADGLAFGFLHSDRTIDIQRTEEITKLIHSYGKEAVFHRAFDLAVNFEEAVKALIEVGVERILTSGGENTALEGANILAYLQKKYGSQIEILAGSGVRNGNVRQLVEQTGVTQIHSSCRGFLKDETARGNGVSFAYDSIPEWCQYETVSEAQVRELKATIDCIHNW